jgi:hypothetical protein
LATVRPSLVGPESHSIVCEIQGLDRDLRSLSSSSGCGAVFRVIITIVRLVVSLRRILLVWIVFSGELIPSI